MVSLAMRYPEFENLILVATLRQNMEIKIKKIKIIIIKIR